MARFHTIFFALLVAAVSVAAPLAPDEKPIANPQGLDAMGRDIRQFGEDVAQRIDRIVKKKTFELLGDPWTMQGIPILIPIAASGFNVGLRIQMQNIVRQDPHEMELIAQVLTSDRGRQKHQISVDFPWAFGNRFRVGARLAYDRDIALRYFGVGNDTPFDLARYRAGDYDIVRGGPSFQFSIMRHFSRHFRAGPTFALKHTAVESLPGSVLATQAPLGIAGGRTHTLGLAIIYDTLDFEPYPSRGDYHELFFSLSNGAVTGSDYDFTRTTYTFRKFVSLNRRLIFAHRTLLEWLNGNVPFYELSDVGGSFGSIGFGGDRYFRGYEPNRFIDKLRLVAGFELRWDPIFAELFRQELTVGFVPFFEIGRVWDGLPRSFDNWHASVGWGVRMIWNSRLVLRVDTALTPEGLNIVGNIGNAF
ncbi:outer membrane protein assembly factor [bacterium]|nr:outer membrane protein assembly factor [bacterium]